MADFQEEVYIIEKKEITDDEDDEEFDQIRQEEEEDDLEMPEELSDSDDDLNDFDALKAKTEKKMA